MKRKVNLVGQNTLTVSLPNEWAKKHKIKKGDEVEVNDHGKFLIIGSPKHNNQEIVEVHFSSKDDYHNRKIVVPYIRGCNEIKITFENPNVINSIIRTLEREMMGFEMVKETSNYCIIKNVSEGLEKEFGVLYKRLIFLIQKFMDEIYAALQKEDAKLMQEALENERMINKLHKFCKRMINIYGYEDPALTNAVYTLVDIYESIGDDLVFICNAFLEHRVNITKDILDLYKNMKTQFENCKGLENVSNVKVRELKVILGQTEKKAVLLSKKYPQSNLITNYILSIFKKIHHISKELG